MSQTYHMIEYIHEEAQALQRTLTENESAIASLVERAKGLGVRRLVISGLGSSWTAALMAEPLFRCHSIPAVHILPATEVGYYTTRLFDRETLAIVVSRSGEREPVVNALRDAVARGAFGVAITGWADSLLAQQAQMALLTREGPEISFPKTKSVIACAGLLMRIALAFAAPDDEEAASRLKALAAAPSAIECVVQAMEAQVCTLIPSIQRLAPVAIVGTGSNHGVALEAACKLQETAYVPTLPSDTGGLFFGPLGAVSEQWLIVALVTAHDLDLSKQLLRLAGRFGARRLAVVEPGLELEGLSDHVLALPERPDPLLSGLVFLPPIDLLTYYWALAKGMNPDEPPATQAMLDAMLPPGRDEPELRKG